MKGTYRRRPSKQVSGLVRNQHQFCSRRIVLTPKSYFLRPETRHRPHQSSQYDAFPFQARDHCFNRLAKMRPNTVTYWTTADYANRETCSFIRLNDALRKTLLQAAKKKSLINRSRKTTSTARADFKCHSVVFYDKERIMGNDS